MTVASSRSRRNYAPRKRLLDRLNQERVDRSPVRMRIASVWLLGRGIHTGVVGRFRERGVDVVGRTCPVSSSDTPAATLQSAWEMLSAQSFTLAVNQALPERP